MSIGYIKIFKQNNEYYIKYIKDNKRIIKKLEKTIPIIALSKSNYEMLKYDENLRKCIIKSIKSRIYQSNNIAYIIKLKSWQCYKKILKEYENLIPLSKDYLLLYQLFKDKELKEVNTNAMNIYALDIEVYSFDNEFPLPEEAKYPISVITIKDINKNIFYVYYYPFKRNKFKSNKNNIVIREFNNEKEMLENFFLEWYAKDFDIVIGWNVYSFDILYLVNRLIKLNLHHQFEDLINFSPYNQLFTINKLPKFNRTYIIDLMEIYRKYFNNRSESYSLNYVSDLELGEGKLEYKEEEGNLTNLYEQNLQKYIEYNIQDVELVVKLEQKLKMLNLVIMIAYSTYSWFDESTSILKIVEKIFNKELLDRKIIPKQKTNFSSKKIKYSGGYVKKPVKGLHKWVAVFDVSSSYPNQVRTWNICNETRIDNNEFYKQAKEKDIWKKLLYVDENEFSNVQLTGFPEENFLDIDKVLNNYTELFKKYNVIYLPGGHLFRKDKYGYLPEIISELYEKRLSYKKLAAKYKKEMLEAEEKYLKLKKQYEKGE